MLVFLSELEVGFSLDHGPENARFDDDSFFIAQNDLNVSVALLSRWPCDTQPEHDSLLQIPRDPIQCIVLAFGIEADRLTGRRAGLQFKPVIAGKRFSSGADNFDSCHGLIERLVVEGDEQVTGPVFAFGVESYVHPPR
tara:strand:- start:48 stop:464 length:417 start_codon:yes stop_codon:yes gene_type:complete